jgi:2-polyprenyl-6-methoxyphenol hydroxylase-like FAD-dependent oxidoreductase
MSVDRPPEVDFDVTIVGYGPIGEMLAIMLGRRGYRVGVFERWPDLYPLPRAVVYDDEIARVFQQEGLLEDIRTISASVPDFYEWRNRDGDALLKIDWSLVGPTGRQVATFFSQPELQELLDRHARLTPGVEVFSGWEVTGLTQAEEQVQVEVRQGALDDKGRWAPSGTTRTVTSRFLVGADGANSTVARQLGIEFEDLGFHFDWLIVDAIPLDDREWRPMNWQLCDPRRPTTIVSGGPGRRRWEFMRLPDETIEELNTEETAWRLLESWGRTPENTTLERHAVYTFEARWAKDWIRGRVALAGDAAHLMPPFAGQGMCAGIRDVTNLVWKLDRVLSGRSPESLLETYGSERAANIQHFIHMSVALGRVICVLDEQAASERDERMIAGDADPARVLPAGPPPRLGPGLARDEGPSGLLMPQGRVRFDGRTALLDEVVPGDFLLLTELPGLERALESLGGQVVTLGPVGSGAPFEDLDQVYLDWLNEHQAGAVLVRPDSYIYGTAVDAAGVSELVEELRRRLGSPAQVVDGQV